MTYTVLIIDKESAQCDLLAHSLQGRLGYRTRACTTAAEATHFFAPDNLQKPDLILLDWASTGGREALSMLKPFTQQAPLVALVKYGDYDAGLEALSAGAQDFLTKPVAIERVSATLRNLLVLKNAYAEVERLRKERVAGSPVTPDHSQLNFLFLGDDGNVRRMEEIEAEVLHFAMQYYHGRRTEVARRLGIGRSTLYRKLSELGMKEVAAA